MQLTRVIRIEPQFSALALVVRENPDVFDSLTTATGSDSWIARVLCFLDTVHLPHFLIFLRLAENKASTGHARLPQRQRRGSALATFRCISTRHATGSRAKPLLALAISPIFRTKRLLQ